MFSSRRRVVEVGVRVPVVARDAGERGTSKSADQYMWYYKDYESND
jgi:hypothetical protein